MANENALNELGQQIDRYDEQDFESIVRPQLGDLSLNEIEPLILDLKEKNRITYKYGTLVSSSIIQQYKDILLSLNNFLKNVSKSDQNTFVSNHKSYLTSLKESYDKILYLWPYVVAAAIEKQGLIDSSVKEQALRSLHEVKAQGERIIAAAKESAEKIESRARKTATNVSVKDAQDQFKKAKDHQLIQIIIWAFLLICAGFAFFKSAFWFLDNEPDYQEKWELIYKLAIRLTLLGALGTITAFCIKVLRAHLHMYQHNQHRERIANSIEAFINAASTKEQKDMILAKLVDSICSFGNSGLLNNQDNNSPSAFTIDNINRSFSPASKTPSD